MRAAGCGPQIHNLSVCMETWTRRRQGVRIVETIPPHNFRVLSSTVSPEQGEGMSERYCLLVFKNYLFYQHQRPTMTETFNELFMETARYRWYTYKFERICQKVSFVVARLKIGICTFTYGAEFQLYGQCQSLTIRNLNNPFVGMGRGA